MRISELNRSPREFGERPDELHTARQRLMYGAEVNDIKTSDKASRVRRKRGISDMLRFVSMSAAAVAVVAVSAPFTDKPVDPPDIPFYEYEEPQAKYSYRISVKTRTETLDEGGYAVLLDIGTDEKKQAFYQYLTDCIYTYLKFVTEDQEKFAQDPEKSLSVTAYSENKKRDIGRLDVGWGTDGSVDPWLCFSSQLASNENYLSDFGRAYDVIYVPSIYLRRTMGTMELFDFTDPAELIKNKYGVLTYDELLEKITGLLDVYFSNPIDNEDVEDDRYENGLYYETVCTMDQLSVLDREVSLELPEFFTVVKDDELYGYKKLTVPKDTDCFLVTGSDEYPLEKPHTLEPTISIENSGGNGSLAYRDYYFYYDLVRSGCVTSKYAADILSASDGNTYYSNYDMRVPNFYGQSGSAHIYSGLQTLRADSDMEIVVSRLSRLIPIQDKYYVVTLPEGGTYTIVNNGDHEVMAIGNPIFNDVPVIKNTDSSFQMRIGSYDHYFNCEPLMPGESLTITVTGGLSTLTMPECCSVTDSSGNAYSASDIEIDLMNGKIKED